MSEAHPLVAAAQNAEEEIGQRLHAELAIAIRGLRTELQLDTDRTKMLDEQLSQATGRLSRLAGLRASYVNLVAESSHRTRLVERAEQNLSEARASAASAKVASLIARIDGPDTGTRPVSASRTLVVLGGLLAGLAVGLGLLLLVPPAVRSRAMAGRRYAARGPGRAAVADGQRRAVEHARRPDRPRPVAERVAQATGRRRQRPPGQPARSGTGCQRHVTPALWPVSDRAVVAGLRPSHTADRRSPEPRRPKVHAAAGSGDPRRTWRRSSAMVVSQATRTPNPTRLSGAVVAALRCPACRSPLAAAAEGFGCTSPDCGRRFPVAHGVPILIDETHSLFRIAGFLRQEPTFFRPRGRLRCWAAGLLPEMSRNVVAKGVLARMRERPVRQPGRPRVLVIGAGVMGVGLEAILDEPAIEAVHSDVSLTPRVQLIADAHDLPFAAGTFDAVIVQAVLEHVVDPVRCVAEIHRVLGREGLVYADTPFMVQVHGREYDFTRYTRLGHRRLFRRFAELESGISGGPAMALGWSLRYFCLSFCRRPAARAVVSGCAAWRWVGSSIWTYSCQTARPPATRPRRSIFWAESCPKPSPIASCSAPTAAGSKSPLSLREMGRGVRAGKQHVRVLAPI